MNVTGQLHVLRGTSLCSPPFTLMYDDDCVGTWSMTIGPFAMHATAVTQGRLALHNAEAAARISRRAGARETSNLPRVAACAGCTINGVRQTRNWVIHVM